MESYALLETGHLPEGATYYHPERASHMVKLDSSAWDIFTDFKSKYPAIIGQDKTLQDALNEMRLAQVKSLIVAGEHDTILGLVCARDIQGVKVGRIASDNGVLIKDVTVGMAMIPASEILTLRFSQLDRIQVGHITRLIHDTGQNYIFVTEPHPDHSEQTRVRGLFSASRISRQLGEHISGDLSAHSLADMNRRIL